MSQEKPSKPTKLCPTCGTRVAEDSTRCLVCGSDLSNTEKSARPQKVVQGSRMPEITLSLPAVLGLFAMFLTIGAGLVWFALRQTPTQAAAMPPTPTLTETVTPTVTLTPTPETPTPTNTPAPTATPVEYTVKFGDQCGAIAASFNVSINSIVLLNPVLNADCSNLIEGQKLLIPQPTPTPTPQPTSTLNPTEAAVAECDKVEYTVQEKDTLSSIAFNYGISMEAIREWNGRVNDVVRFGEVIIIPLCMREREQGPTPTATPPPPYPAPNLLLPADGGIFTAGGEAVTLQWASVGTLRENEAYAVLIEDVTAGEARQTFYVNDTKYIVPASLRSADGQPHVYRWSVMPVRSIGANKEGQPLYEGAGAASVQRVFIWGGAGAAPAVTPTPP